MIEPVIPLLYLAAAASFVLALKWLSAVPTARRGVHVGAAGTARAGGGAGWAPPPWGAEAPGPAANAAAIQR